MRKKTHAEFVEQMSSINPSIIVEGKYDGDRVKILCSCTVCSYQWLATPSHLIQGKGCPSCGKKKSDNSKRKSHSQFVAELMQINPNVVLLQEYVSSHYPICVRCKKCGFVWSPIPSSLLRGTGCPQCAGTMKKDHSLFIAQLNAVNGDVEVIGQYINDGEKIHVRCKKCSNEWSATPNSLLQGHGCKRCGSERASKKRTTEHDVFINRLKDINPDVIVLDKYRRANDPIHAKCEKCGYEWVTKPSLLLSGRGCHLCGIKKQSDSIRKTQEQFEQELSAVNPNIVVLGRYFNTATKIKVSCTKCGNVWENSPGNLLSGRGCPKCAKYLHTSFPEQAIYYYIRKVYPDAVNSYKDVFEKNMELDIFIPSISLGIEYDGKVWHSSAQAHDRDRRKYLLCKEKSILLIRIREIELNADNEIADCIIYSDDSVEMALDRLFKYLNINVDVDIERDKQSIFDQYININAHEDFLNKLAQINTNVIPLSKYTLSRNPILCLCKKCDYQWNSSPNKLLSGHGCPRCAGKMKKDTSQFIRDLEKVNEGIIVIGEYINASSPIEVKCKKCHFIWNPVASSLLAGNGCPRCSRRVRITHDQFVEELSKINSDIIVLEEYKAKRNPVTVQCKKCGRKWNAIPDSLLRGHGCASCAGFLKKNTEEFKQELSLINNEFEVVGEYINARTKILVVCKRCGFERNAVPYSLKKGLKCPHCDK